MSILTWLRRADTTAAEPRGPEGVAPASGPQDLTLQDLTLLKVALSWQEAVAVVLELIDGLSDRAHFPNPAQVVLTEIGETRTAGARNSGGHPVRVAASLLGELLPSAGVPAELRSTIDQNVVAEPRHKTLDEFGAALAYFERPGRRGDVAAVYGRAHTMHAKAAADLELERLRARAAREQEVASAKPAAPAPWRARAVQAAVIAALLVVIAGGTTALFTMAFAPAPPTADPAETDTRPSTEDSSPASKLAAAVGEAKRLASEGLAKAITAVAAKKEPEPAPVPAPTRPKRTRPAAAAVAATADASASGESVAPTRNATPAVEMFVSAKDIAASAPSSAAPVDVIEVFASEREPAYTSLDAVQPATLVRPQLPSRLVDGSPAPDASVLDMIVDEAGRVEFVRLEGTHSDVSEKMLVSAAKAWLFEPALREGRPVRYRLRVQISE